MRSLAYLIVGIFFGITMYKSEAASWFRIYEMFQFHAFHMYGIIGSALALGVAGIFIIKKYNIKALGGKDILFTPKQSSIKRYLYGGTIFGLGWGLAGACPGPIFTLIGSGYLSLIVVLASAFLGTYVYGLLKNKLPH
jgi:uncharacterized membrane protein YedE/YeeE